MSSQQDLYSMMVKLDERQKTIFNMLARVEKHLEKLKKNILYLVEFLDFFKQLKMKY